MLIHLKQGTFVVDDNSPTATRFPILHWKKQLRKHLCKWRNCYKIDNTTILVSNFTYNHLTGVAEITTTVNHGLSVGDVVTLSGINVSCTFEGSVQNKVYPESPFVVTSLTCESGTGNKDVIGRADTLTALITSNPNGTNALENYPPKDLKKQTTHVKEMLA